MELKDTAVMMTSAEYKVRFRAEFEQTRIRHQKLLDMIEKYKAGTLDFIPTCPVELLERQAKHMYNYLAVLEERAAIEGIDIYVDCAACDHMKPGYQGNEYCQSAHRNEQRTCYTPKAQEERDVTEGNGCIIALVPRKTKREE